MIKANIETEIAPIVGTQQQAQDLIHYISDAETSKEGIWETNIFGKTIEQLVNDGITSKITMIGEESQMKLQDTMQKIVNDSKCGKKQVRETEVNSVSFSMVVFYSRICYT